MAIILSPKARFLKTQDAKMLADLVVTPAFQNCLSVALSELQMEPNKQNSSPADNWNRLQGAKDFIRILINLPEPPERPKRGVPRENLQPTT